jgi:hypothetical protein
MGERGDIIKTMHRTIAERGIDRAVDRYVIHHGPRQETVRRPFRQRQAGTCMLKDIFEHR